jgi:C1A family cysteine protease
MKGLLIWSSLLSSFNPAKLANVPTAFDLRSVDGKSYVSSVKNQSGGTCWTHGTMSAVESNLFVTGAWTQNNEDGEPNLAEYHLDWWNGFNKHMNADIAPATGGLTVHQGGDYRVAQAYFARGGAVRDSDGQSFSKAPDETSDDYHFYYVRDIEWIAGDDTPETTARIKAAIVRDGVVGTALDWSSSFYNSSNHTFYQPASSSAEPNHAVAIVGWDDEKETKADEPGAWLIKNSWGESWGEAGYFWISYHDKTAAHHPQMGAVSFRNTERMKYNHVYSHDYPGWRDTKDDAMEAFNAFTAVGSTKATERLKAVSLINAVDNVDYTVTVYGAFDGTELKNPLSTQSGKLATTGFHTIDLTTPVPLKAGDKFYVYVKVSAGGQAFDRTSDVPVLLGAKYRATVESAASPGESYYKTAAGWVDLTKDNETANFCIKGLSVFE